MHMFVLQTLQGGVGMYGREKLLVELAQFCGVEMFQCGKVSCKNKNLEKGWKGEKKQKF